VCNDIIIVKINEGKTYNLDDLLIPLVYWETKVEPPKKWFWGLISCILKYEDNKQIMLYLQNLHVNTYIKVNSLCNKENDFGYCYVNRFLQSRFTTPFFSTVDAQRAMSMRDDSSLPFLFPYVQIRFTGIQPVDHFSAVLLPYFPFVMFTFNLRYYRSSPTVHDFGPPRAFPNWHIFFTCPVYHYVSACQYFWTALEEFQASG
jgi:hypothetical protein